MEAAITDRWKDNATFFRSGTRKTQFDHFATIFRQLGPEIERADYVLFMDDDDYFLSWPQSEGSDLHLVPGTQNHVVQRRARNTTRYPESKHGMMTRTFAFAKRYWILAEHSYLWIW